MLFIACFLCASSYCTTARASDNDEPRIRALTTENIKAFLNILQEIGQGQDNLPYDMSAETYLQRHLADNAYYESAMVFNIPGMPPEKTTMKMDKLQYIHSLQKGLSIMHAHETTMKIDKIDIARNKRQATLETTITEKGEIPWGEKNGAPRMVNVIGISECEQNIVIPPINRIQLAKAVCSTKIKLDPFAGKKLDDPF